MLLHLLESFIEATPNCLFHTVTGLYCPGCGGTRALFLFLQGHWLLSFLYHPLVVYGFFVCIFLFIKRILCRNSVPNFFWLWGALILLAANFIIKNAAILLFHRDLMTYLL